MGELYNPYPKLPKNIRQIGERDQIVKLYVEDYVNTYLKRLYPTGGKDLRVGLLLGEMRSQEGVPYLFVDGALEMEGVTQEGEKVVFTEDAWKRAYQTMEQMFPRRAVLGWFLCGAPGSALSPLNYWKQHGQYFSGKHQLMYLNSGLEGEEAVYVASEDGFYKIRGYCIYYERNQMMQDYMVSRKDAHRVETGARDTVIQDFRQRLGEKKVQAIHRRSTVSRLGTACGALSVLVLASGVVMFNNYQKMKMMESVIASAIPENREVEIEEIPGEVYPTLAEIQIDDEGVPAGAEGSAGAADNEKGTGNMNAGGNGGVTEHAEMGGNSASAPTVSAPTAQPVDIPSDAVRHTVKPGETLYGICMEHYNNMSNIEIICLWNNLGDGNHITVGQELMLPPE
ncbi:MAG: LysM peptidoglycan-binding domain-containing protein [Brotaphodocola sp.]